MKRTAEQRYRSRRFILTVSACLIYVSLLVNGYIGEAIFRDLQIMTIGAYIAGNGFQKFTDAKYAGTTESTGS